MNAATSPASSGAWNSGIGRALAAACKKDSTAPSGNVLPAADTATEGAAEVHRPLPLHSRHASTPAAPGPTTPSLYVNPVNCLALPSRTWPGNPRHRAHARHPKRLEQVATAPALQPGAQRPAASRPGHAAPHGQPLDRRPQQATCGTATVHRWRSTPSTSMCGANATLMTPPHLRRPTAKFTESQMAAFGWLPVPEYHFLYLFPEFPGPPRRRARGLHRHRLGAV